MLVGVLTDNLHGVLVGTHGTVGTQTEELALLDRLSSERHLFHNGQRGEGHVVYDAHGEVVLGFGQFEVVEYGDNLGGSHVGRAETVAATHDEGTVLYVIEGALHVEVQRLTLCSGLLGAVEHGDALAGGGHGSEQVLHGEGTIEVNAHHTYLLALLYEVVDGLAGSLGGRTHEDDDVLGILGTIVVEEVILTAGDFGNLAQVVFHHFGHLVVVLVAGLTVGEGLRVLGGTAGNGALGSEGTVAEGLDVGGVDELGHVFHLHHLHLMILVRGAETVEEVDEGHPGLQGSQVGNSGQVHHLLYGTGAEHGEAGLAAGHHILVVTEDTE